MTIRKLRLVVVVVLVAVIATIITPVHLMVTAQTGAPTAYAKINKSGSCEYKGNCRVRLDFYLETTDARFFDRYIPTTNSNNETVWTIVPFHTHFVYLPYSFSESDLTAQIDLHLPNFYAAYQQGWDAVEGGMRHGWDIRSRARPPDHSKTDTPAQYEARVAACEAAIARLTEFEYKIDSGILGETFPSTEIDIGAAATDRSNTADIAGSTWVEGSNPANDTGTIDYCEIWLAASSSSNVWVGTFSASGNVLTVRDSESIGAIAAGSKQTASALDVDVNSGDYWGCHSKSGTASIERDLVGYTQAWSFAGECIDPSDSETFGANMGDQISLWGTGETAGGTPPTVDSDAADDIEDTTATLNGNVTAVGDSVINARAFVWDTSTHGDPGSSTPPHSSDYAYSWNETGTYGLGVFDHGVTSLATATTHYFRAAARNDNTLWDYGDELTFLTKPAAPTNVGATDGVHTDKVAVSWTKSSGTVTGYKIYRDGGLIDTVGDVATYDDTGADAPTITPGAAVASDGTYPDKVNLYVSGESANPGTTHTYKVRAYNGSGDSDDSATDTGYRGVGSLTYQWQRSSGCSDAGYSNMGGATTETYDDMGAPAPTLIANNATACDGCSSSYVTLSANETASNGDCRWYKCVLDATGAAQQSTTANSGYRGTSAISYQWYRSAADSDGNYSTIAGATTDPYNDAGGVEEPDGRYYKCLVAMSGADSSNTTADRGYMSSSNLTALYVYPESQSGCSGTNETLWAVAWVGAEWGVGYSVSWNTSGNGSIVWCENVTGADGRADCIVTFNGTGNQTVCCNASELADCGMVSWAECAELEDFPLWYFAILGCALIGAWFTKEIILYVMALVACGGMVWWVQNSSLDDNIALTLIAVFVILGGVMIFGILRRGQFSFVQGGDSE